MLRNIDIVNSILYETEQADKLAAMADHVTQCEDVAIEQLDEIGQSKLVDDTLAQVQKIVFLYSLLTQEYAEKAGNVFELLGEIAESRNSREMLIENWDAVMEKIYAISDSCQDDLEEFRRMEQPCYLSSVRRITITNSKDKAAV